MAKIRQNCNGIFEIVHTPSAVLDYSFDWTGWLQTNEAVTSSTWTINPTLTLTNPTLIGAIATTFVSGGVMNSSYTLTNTVNTSQGRTDSRTMILNCQNKGIY